MPRAASRTAPLASSLIMSAPFSAIIIVAALGVARRHGRHDRGINHAPACNAVHPQPVIDHRHPIMTHSASADRWPCPRPVRRA